MADSADDDDKRNAALWLDFELRLAILCHLVGKHLHEEVLIYDLMAGSVKRLEGQVSSRQMLPTLIAQNRYEAFLSNWMLEHGCPTGFTKPTHQLTREQISFTENDIAAALFYLSESRYVRCIDERFQLTKPGWEYLKAQLDMVQKDAISLQLQDHMLIGFEWNDDPMHWNAFAWDRHGRDWSESALQIAILRVLLDAHKTRPLTGGVSAKMIMDVLNLSDLKQLELSIRFLLSKGYIEMCDRLFQITYSGIEFLNKKPKHTTFH